MAHREAVNPKVPRLLVKLAQAAAGVPTEIAGLVRQLNLILLSDNSGEGVLRSRAPLKEHLGRMSSLIGDAVSTLKANAPVSGSDSERELSVVCEFGELVRTMSDGGFRFSAEQAATLLQQFAVAARFALLVSSSNGDSSGISARDAGLLETCACLGKRLLLPVPQLDAWYKTDRCALDASGDESESDDDSYDSESVGDDADSGMEVVKSKPVSTEKGSNVTLLKPSARNASVDASPTAPAAAGLAEQLTSLLCSASIASSIRRAYSIDSLPDNGATGGSHSRFAAAAANDAAVAPSILHSCAQLCVLLCELSDASGLAESFLSTTLEACAQAAVTLPAHLPASSDSLQTVLATVDRLCCYVAHRQGAVIARNALDSVSAALPLVSSMTKAWVAAVVAADAAGGGGVSRRNRRSAASSSSSSPSADNNPSTPSFESASSTPFTFVTGGVRPKAAKAIGAEVQTAVVEAGVALLHARVATSISCCADGDEARVAAASAAVNVCIVAASSTDDGTRIRLEVAQAQLLAAAGLPPSVLSSPLPLSLPSILAVSPLALSHTASALARALSVIAARPSAGTDAAPAAFSSAGAAIDALSSLLFSRVCPRLASGLREARRYSSQMQSQLLSAGARVTTSLTSLLSSCASLLGPSQSERTDALLSGLQTQAMVDAALTTLGRQADCAAMDGASAPSSVAPPSVGVGIAALDLLSASAHLAQLLERHASPSVSSEQPRPSSTAVLMSCLIGLCDVITDGYVTLRLSAGMPAVVPSVDREGETENAPSVDGRAAGQRLMAVSSFGRGAGAMTSGGDNDGDEDEEESHDQVAALTLHAVGCLQALLAGSGSDGHLLLLASSSPLQSMLPTLSSALSAPALFDDDAVLDGAAQALMAAVLGHAALAANDRRVAS